jgi:hypothetical protein
MSPSIHIIATVSPPFIYCSCEGLTEEYNGTCAWLDVCSMLPFIAWHGVMVGCTCCIDEVISYHVHWVGNTWYSIGIVFLSYTVMCSIYGAG